MEFSDLIWTELCFNQFDPIEGTERAHPVGSRRVARSFNQFDPIEGTESQPGQGHCYQPGGFNQFDPIEGTESISLTCVTYANFPFQPIRPNRGY